MTLLSHLPALLVVVPMAVAPLVAVLPSRSRLGYVLATLTAGLTFVIAILLSQQVATQGAMAYEMGSWPVPFGIGLMVTPFSAVMALIISGGSLVSLLWGAKSLDSEMGREHHALFLSCWLLASSGLLGIVVTADAFNAFVFMEISSLASYVLVAAGPKRQSLTAAFKYLVTGSLGATFYLIGVGYLYMMTGTLNFDDLTARLPEVSETTPVLIASGFIMLGLALKAAVFPMHAWMPTAYQFAPTPIAIFFAASSTKVALFLLIKFDYLVLQPNLSDHAFLFSTILMPMATLAFLVGSSVAIFSKDLKRMLGYSSVAQIGYILIASSLVTSAGLTAAIVHIFNHALIKSALFMAVGCLFWRFGTSNIQDLAGAAKVMPITMAGFVVAGLSLIGVPLTAGFISKVTLIQALLELGSLGFVLLSLVLISSLMAVIYIWRVVEVTYFGKPAESSPSALKGEAPWPMLVTLWVLVLANIYFGIEPSLPLGLAGAEVKLLLGGPQE
ncbi:MAG: monovalent cation/H+ antiporter subunit D family protein [Burkholderiaceae bacterium]